MSTDKDIKAKQNFKNETNRNSRVDTFYLIASLRRSRSTQKYTTKPRNMRLMRGFKRGLCGYFSICCALYNLDSL